MDTLLAIPPAKITDLTVLMVSDLTVTLQWTAAGDDGESGSGMYLAVAHSLRCNHGP